VGFNCGEKKRGTFDPNEAEILEEELYKSRSLMSEGDVASFLSRKTHGHFLTMFLGLIYVHAN